MQISLAVIGAILLVIGLWLYVGPSDPTEKKDFIQAVGILLAGLVGLGGLYFTWQNLKQTRDSTERQLEQARESQKTAQESTRKTLELTEQGQITERFTRAIDQLGATDNDGNPRLEVRLGGIYGLERIDKESPERAYHSTVMEILTAYVRENAPWPPKSSKSPERGFIKPFGGGSVSDSTSNEAAEQDKGTEQGTEPAKELAQGAVSTDIQAILDILKRREEESVPEKYRVLLDLRGTDLRGANLEEVNLQKANLRGANLQGADLREANLQGADLRQADFRETIFEGANLQGANLQGANLQGVFIPFIPVPGFYGANFKETHLQGTNLQGATLQGVSFQGAWMREVNLQEAIITEVDLQGANLYAANLLGAKLRGSNGLPPVRRTL